MIDACRDNAPLHPAPRCITRTRRGGGSRAIALWVVAVACSLLPLTAQAQDAEPSRGEGERWVDPVFGLSLVPPDGSEVRTRPGNRELVRFTADSGEQIVVKIKRNQYKLTLAELFKRMRAELLGGVLNLTEVADKEVAREIDGHEAVVRYYLLDQKNRPNEALAIALMPLDEERFLDIRGMGLAREYERLRDRFERTLATLRTPDLRELYRQREVWLRRGDALVDGVSTAELLEAFAGERWYRILGDRGDVGYERVRVDRGREAGVKGLRLHIDRTLRGRSARRDRASMYFTSLQEKEEVWSTRVTRRFGRAMPGTPGGKTQSWSETGVRGTTQLSGDVTLNRIEVTRELPTGEVQREAWPTPGNAYATVAERRLLAAHHARRLARGAAAEKLAFYAYSEDSFAVTLQTIDPTIRPNGRIELRVRASPEQPEERWVFDGNGRLLERHDGETTYQLSSHRELQRIWNDGRGLPGR